MNQIGGTIQTVLGPVPATALSYTLTHEHLLADVTPPGLFAPGAHRVKITLENVWDVRYQWCGHYGNQILDDPELMASEMKTLKADGGTCLIEQTSRGLSPDPEGLARISRESGINVVAGTGFYTVEFAGKLLADQNRSEISERLHADLTAGIDGTAIRAGLIGEMGLSTPPHADEIKALTAACPVQKRTGAGMCIHPPREPAAPRELVELVGKNGGLVEKTAIAHLERTLPTRGDFLDLAQTGCFLELDFFGLESGFYPFAPIDMPNDAGRLSIMRALIDAGHLEQILISQDICHRSRLRHFGGEGYGHIFRNVVPMMRARQFEQGEIDAILIDNPKRFLALN